MDVLIVGATARAAAMSAIRAGWNPTTIDLFADRDLQAIAETIQVDPANYPLGLMQEAMTRSPRPWIYTGGLENYPNIVDRISHHHHLWGNDGTILRQIRDPVLLSQVLKEHDFQAPAVSLVPENLDPSMSWLIKPRASAGGLRVEHWAGTYRDLDRQASYFQQFIPGECGSAVYLADRLAVELVAITQQLVGEPGRPFVYRGNCLPMAISEDIFKKLVHLGTILKSRFDLRGVFGVDFILHEDHPWPIEVNPRYTASIELVEWSTGRSLLAEHRQAFDQSAPRMKPSRGFSGVVGKLIVYARAPSKFPPIQSIRSLCRDPFTMPRCADIPPNGESFQAGDPILTLLGDGATEEQCLSRLERRAAQWRLKGSGTILTKQFK